MVLGAHGNSLFFNVDDGMLEAQVHGKRDGLLRQTDYQNLSQCDTLEGRSLCSLSLSLGGGGGGDGDNNDGGLLYPHSLLVVVGM